MSPEWAELTQDDRAWVTNSCDAIKKTVDATIDGLQKLISHYYDLNERLRALRGEIESRAKANQSARGKPVPDGEKGGTQPPEAITEMPIFIPETFEDKNEIFQLIEQLQNYCNQILSGKRIRLITKLISKRLSK